MIPDLTYRTRLGAVDLVPMLRRAEGDYSAPIPDGEREAGALALHGLGWSVEQIHRATGLNSIDIRDIIAGVPKRRNAAQTHCEAGHELTEENIAWVAGYRRCRPCRRAYERESRRARRQAS